ncbi:hypothetical protein JPH1_20570 [Mycobacterium avium subsp. hominissuis]|uniref:Uncharacterized protein n=1 Tax=Mycobacterium avium subsp. hominissuis TaxID=439334 RepID=A0AAI8X2B0_MYCAV|nr:hypothetical protein JPH1_20570 [Mycobacterium avium subsp. hominissuis]
MLLRDGAGANRAEITGNTNGDHEIRALQSFVNPRFERAAVMWGRDVYRSRPVEWCKSGRVSACGSVVATMP